MPTENTKVWGYHQLGPTWRQNGLVGLITGSPEIVKPIPFNIFVKAFTAPQHSLEKWYFCWTKVGNSPTLKKIPGKLRVTCTFMIWLRSDIKTSEHGIYISMYSRDTNKVNPCVSKVADFQIKDWKISRVQSSTVKFPSALRIPLLLYKLWI